MGFGGIGIWQLLIILIIIMLVFGTKKLKNIGTDLGGAIKGFKSAMDEEGNKDQKKTQAQISDSDDGDTFDVKAEKTSQENKEENKS